MRSCPDCSKPLVALTLRAATLERCTCGGVWAPFGELEKVLEHEVVSEALGGQTSRRCPDCTLTMTPMVLPGGVPIETCSACRGTWLDWADVVELRVKDLEAAVRPSPLERYAPFVSPDAAPAKSVTGFACAKCGTRTEFTKGHGTSRGLVCGACVAQIQPMPRIPDVLAVMDDDD
ncbi:MAG: zf-TFIIB domain-containing protein [Archangium sp.]|nr:zf-TFIIB domain-containing protein [Archangium sp.]